jgi:hypothetical protein
MHAPKIHTFLRKFVAQKQSTCQKQFISYRQSERQLVHF